MVAVFEEAGESTLPVSLVSVVSTDCWLLIEGVSLGLCLWLDDPSKGPRKSVFTLLMRCEKEVLCLELFAGLVGGVGRQPSRLMEVDPSDPNRIMSSTVHTLGISHEGECSYAPLPLAVKVRSADMIPLPFLRNFGGGGSVLLGAEPLPWRPGWGVLLSSSPSVGRDRFMSKSCT